MFSRFVRPVLRTQHNSWLKGATVTAFPTSGFHNTSKCLAGLSPQTVQIVKATAPVLAEHGYNITRTMYKKIFAENPDIKALFNQTHHIQLPNEEKARQPWALACSVHAYAANIENLGALTEAVERIAQKHVSLYILPEHYPIVGQNLLWAIKEVLGDAATDDVMDAWKEAFFFLADIFIQRERELREEKAKSVGGWEGWREFVVDQKVRESSEIMSFYLRPKDGGPLMEFSPGQYTAIRVNTPEISTQRNYTLSKPPGHPYYRISVKREGPMVEGAPNGLVSNWLHDEVKEGDILELGVPCGDFVLNYDPNKPIVLISGGVGLTPVISMLEYLVERKHKGNIVMVNAARDPDAEAMHDILAKYRRGNLNLVIKTIYDNGPEPYPIGPLSMGQLDQVLTTRDCHYFFCGPSGFMKTVYKGLHEWKIPKEQIHYEFFGPHDELLE